jgi:site-specific DNA-methyltransferase (adenine-specific)
MKPTWETSDGAVKLWLGDCLDVLPTWEAGSVDMIWTDPPFGHGNQDGDLQAARVRDGVKGARVRDAEPIANDAGEGFWACLAAFYAEAARVLNRDCCCCCCCMGGGGPKPTFANVSLLADEHLAFFQAIVWDKSARGNGMGWRYRRNYEFVLVAHRKGGKLLWNEDQTAVPNIVRHCPPIDRVHPNEKPVAMVEDFVSWHTTSAHLVADPFMGSGTTGVACVRLGRQFAGIEQDESHFTTAVKRIEAELNRAPLFEAPPQIVQRSLI